MYTRTIHTVHKYVRKHSTYSTYSKHSTHNTRSTYVRTVQHSTYSIYSTHTVHTEHTVNTVNIVCPVHTVRTVHAHAQLTLKGFLDCLWKFGRHDPSNGQYVRHQERSFCRGTGSGLQNYIQIVRICMNVYRLKP